MRRAQQQRTLRYSTPITTTTAIESTEKSKDGCMNAVNALHMQINEKYILILDNNKVN